MSLLVIHLCWTDAGPEELARLQRLLPPVRLLREGPCLHRRTWPSGSRVLGIEVWGDDDAARRHLDELPLDSVAAGLEAPTVVVLVFPEAYRSVLPIVVGTTGEDRDVLSPFAAASARR
ncbi:hypothetical protein [Geodermatophilus nigrescens]|uniref:Quinol monooxygenase YgiN n=1 Tax=Geodermatophilus nigrescens TaxID=1070870 RepID=A0A1M5I4Z8_9ACTN|nr:hypothetical protein [Geodermatophilus nigrescens]SHG23020.1 hypothetical protein SAMN05444351_1884 [Geodermatophilus nigrescens]